MNPFLLKPDERLESWKSIRNALKDLDESEALQLVAEYWAQAPMLKMAYDPALPDEWPSPWEMVSDGDWCPYSVATGMEFTLRLAGWAPERMQILHIRDYDISDERCVLKIDESVFLNYNEGFVVDIPTTRYDVLGTVQSNGKRYFLATK